MWWRCEAELIRLALAVRCASPPRTPGLLVFFAVSMPCSTTCMSASELRVTNPFQPSRGYPHLRVAAAASAMTSGTSPRRRHARRCRLAPLPSCTMRRNSELTRSYSSRASSAGCNSSTKRVRTSEVGAAFQPSALPRSAAWRETSLFVATGAPLSGSTSRTSPRPPQNLRRAGKSATRQGI